MGLTRMEINFRRLLSKCELMVKTKQKDEERFPHFLDSLDGMLKNLIISGETSSDAVDDYKCRIDKLKLSLGILPNSIDGIQDHSKDESSKLSDREALLGGLKHRKVSKTTTDSNDLNDLIDYHENMQQKLADDMLLLTKNLKEQSEIANKIIKKDTEIVSKSTQLSENNFSRLKVETNKLGEHSKRACKCWMWIMLAIVMVVFINMALFMKVMKKKY